MSLSEQKRLLLLKGLKNSGRITSKMAKQLYSGSTSAKNALSSLEYRGFIELHKENKMIVSGVFDIVRVPDDVKEKYKEWEKRE